MQFKGTPGPWIKKVTNKGGIVAIIPTIHGERTIETILHVGKIYEDDCGNELCCRVEEHSNARLIATSPELLDVCIKLMECYNSKGQLLDFDVNIVREAVNKALGL